MRIFIIFWQELILLKVAQNEFLGIGIVGTHTTHSIDNW